MHEHDEPLKELSRELDVAPSPAFAARVRERVEHTRTSGVVSRWVLAAAGVAIAAVVWFGVIPRAPQVQAPATQNVAMVPASPPSLAESAPTIAPAVRPSAAASAPPVRQPRRPAARPADELPEVLVPSDQMVGLQQLRAALLDGRLKPSDLPANQVTWEAPADPVLGSPVGPGESPDNPMDELERRDGTQYSE
jgi:hypothetical protein